MIGLLRPVHAGVPGTAEDFVYVLMTLLVLPLRWTDAHGWRRRLAFNAVLRARAVKVRTRPLPTSPSFVPGTANIAVHPGGYTLDQIGPGAGVNAARN